MRIVRVLCAWMCVAAVALIAADAAPADAAKEAPPPPDEIVLKDGSLIKGQIQTMTGGKLVVLTEFGGAITVKWADVAGLKTARPLDFKFEKESGLSGSAAPVESGTIAITSPSLGGPASVKLQDVTAINPPPFKPVTYKGSANLAASVSDGNTRTKSVSGMVAFEARSERQRLTASAATNYAKDEDGLRVRNSNARIKYDYFITKRLYWFASAFFEGDYFQDLKLRTALSTGPGCQIIDRGDFESEALSKLEVFGEAGVSYFNEDFRHTDDDSYIAGRWALKVDWPFWTDRVTFFHFHEGYPSLEDLKDFYITSATGFRFNLTGNFNAGVQVNYRYDSTPSEGNRRGDALYLLTLGYSFEA